MRCEQAKRRISDARDGALGEGRAAARLERHLKECPACRSYRNDLARIQAAMTGLADPGLAPADWDGLGRRIEARLAREAGDTVRQGLPAFWKLAWAGAGLLALVFAVSYLAFFRPRTAAGPVPLSFEESVAQVMGEVGTNQDLAGAFNREIVASIAEASRREDEETAVSFGDNPLFWEGLSDGELRYIESELRKEAGRGGVS